MTTLFQLFLPTNQPPLSRWDEDGKQLAYHPILCAWRDSPPGNNSGSWKYAVMTWDGEYWTDCETGDCYDAETVEQWCLIKPPLG